MSSAAARRFWSALFLAGAVVAAPQEPPLKSLADFTKIGRSDETGRFQVGAADLRGWNFATRATPFQIRYPLEKLVDVESTYSAFAEPRRADVPLLSGLPVLGGLFRHETAPKLTPPEAWLATYLPQAVDAPLGVRFEETRTRRYDAEKQEVSARREMVVSGPEEARAKTEEILAALASQRRKAVMTSITLISRPAGPDAKADEKVERIDADAARRLLATAKSGKNADVIAAPRVLTTAGERALITITDSVSYIKDFNLEIAEGAVLMDPVVDVVNEGISIGVTPFLDAKGEQVMLDFSFEWTAAARPIPTVEAKIGDQTLRVERPEIATLRWAPGGLLEPPSKGGALRISGLLWTDPKTRKNAFVEILIATESVSDAPSTPPVAVYANDHDPLVVVLDVRDRDDLNGAKKDDQIEVLRGDRVVGRWRVKGATEGMLVLGKIEGERPTGDATVRVAK
jgi:hypothetical protein